MRFPQDVLFITKIFPHNKAHWQLRSILDKLCQSTAAAYAAQINAFVDAPYGSAWRMFLWELICLMVPLLSLS